MAIPIQIPSLIGGVVRIAQSQRDPSEVQNADNVSISQVRGIEKRAASLLVGTAPLTATNPGAVGNRKHVGWIDRDETERFAFIIDPVGSITTITCSTDITVGPRPGNRVLQAVTLAEGIVVDTDLAANIIRVVHVAGTAAFNNVNTISEVPATGPMTPDPVTPTTVVAGTLDHNRIIEVFGIDGIEETVTLSDPVIAYLAFNSQIAGYDPRRRIRSLTVADRTFFLARNVQSALRGAAITYRNLAGSINVRNKNTSPHNKASWSDLEHPPTTASTPIPDLSGEFGAANPIDRDEVWFTREDDVGNPQGWWWAISDTQPPWYQRIRTEGIFSMVNERTFPMQMTFNGTLFTLGTIPWTDRYSGDATTNPGPSYIGSPISALSLHQNRLYLASGEILGSSQTDDLFNLFDESEMLNVDSDPIDTPTSNNRVSNIDFLVPFREAILITTSGGKQFELRADGPMGPNTAYLAQTTAVKGVNYVEPATIGDQVYFMGERNFANTLFEYFFDPNQQSNKANDVTATTEGYIPAESSLIAAAESHDTLFILTDAAANEIYVYKPKFNEQKQKVMSAWYRWTFPTGTEILSCHVFDEDLYLLVRRNALLWFERIAVETPQIDTIGAAPSLESMGFQVRLDRRLTLQGVYNGVTDVTVWTVPFQDAAYTEIVLGPGWDVDVGPSQQRLAGTRLLPTVVAGGGVTTLTVPGQFQFNLNGDPEVAYVGVPYTMTIELSEQFVRSDQGQPIQGVVKILSGVARHKDTGFYAVRVTAENRTPITKEFLFQRVGATFLDADFVETDGEFQFRSMGEAHSTKIEIINDSPLPSNIVDLQFMVMFRPSKKDPTR